MLSSKTIVLVAVLFAVTIQLASAQIFCNDKGICTGDGGPGGLNCANYNTDFTISTPLVDVYLKIPVKKLRFIGKKF